MTIIITLVTKNRIYQASDRRLTSFDKHRRIINSNANKAIYDVEGIFHAYTGLAEIHGKPTDMWLAEELLHARSKNFMETLTAVKNRTNEDFERMTFHRSYLHHTFQSIGWFRTSETSTSVVPVWFAISNSLDRSTGEPTNKQLPNSEFIVHAGKINLDRLRFSISSVGYSLTENHKGAIYRFIKPFVKREVDAPNAIVSALVMAVRWLSDVTGPVSTIGRDVLVNYLPREHAEQNQNGAEGTILLMGPGKNLPSTLYFPDGGPPVYYGPIVLTDETIIFNSSWQAC